MDETWVPPRLRLALPPPWAWPVRVELRASTDWPPAVVAMLGAYWVVREVTSETPVSSCWVRWVRMPFSTGSLLPVT